jgi:hypothetical protein
VPTINSEKVGEINWRNWSAKLIGDHDKKWPKMICKSRQQQNQLKKLVTAKKLACKNRPKTA